MEVPNWGVRKQKHTVLKKNNVWNLPRFEERYNCNYPRSLMDSKSDELKETLNETHGNETAERQWQKESWKKQEKSELSHTSSLQ